MTSDRKCGWTSWVYLSGAIVFEVSGTTCMKLSDGFHNIVPAILMIPFYILCFGCLTLAIRKIDVSIAYAVWAGIGTTLITMVGILWFKDPATLLKIASIGLIIIGMLVVWGVVAAALWRRMRNASDVGDGPEDGSSSSSIAALAGVGGILVTWSVLALAEFPGHLVPTQLILGLAAGIACRRNASAAADSAPLPVARRIATCGAAMVLALVPAWLALSDALHVSGDPAAALRVNPWNGEAAFASGLEEQLGRAPTGCSRLERAAATAPSPAAALALGNCYQRRGMIPQAVEAYRRAIRWNPRNAAAHGNLAMALLDAGDDEAARRHAARARSLRPGDPAIVALYRRVTDAPRGERPE